MDDRRAHHRHPSGGSSSHHAAATGGTSTVTSSKVSQIANIFTQHTPSAASHHHHQAQTPSANVEHLARTNSPSPPPPPSAIATPAQITVMRTESHLARFNTARALFEKLGEENRSGHHVQVVNKKHGHHRHHKLENQNFEAKRASSKSPTRPTSNNNQMVSTIFEIFFFLRIYLYCTSVIFSLVRVAQEHIDYECALLTGTLKC